MQWSPWSNSECQLIRTEWCSPTLEWSLSSCKVRFFVFIYIKKVQCMICLLTFFKIIVYLASNTNITRECKLIFAYTFWVITAEFIYDERGREYQLLKLYITCVNNRGGHGGINDLYLFQVSESLLSVPGLLTWVWWNYPWSRSRWLIWQW